MKLEKDEYFTDDSLVKDAIYLSLKDLLTCPLCNKILKNPFMCTKCQTSYCKTCLEKDSNLKICPNDKKESQFVHCVMKNEMLSKLKYKCKNCLKEVAQNDINAHLEENCEKKETERRKTLAEEIKTKKKLIKLTPKEMENKKADRTFTGKKIFYIILIYF